MKEAIRFEFNGVPEVHAHIRECFGSVQECGGCGVCAPPEGAMIEVVEPIQCFWGPQERMIEPCIYKVGRIDPGMSSHFIDLERNDGETFHFCIGYAPIRSGLQIDWRGARKAEES